MPDFLEDRQRMLEWTIRQEWRNYVQSVETPDHVFSLEASLWMAREMPPWRDVLVINYGAGWTSLLIEILWPQAGWITVERSDAWALRTMNISHDGHSFTKDLTDEMVNSAHVVIVDHDGVGERMSLVKRLDGVDILVVDDCNHKGLLKVAERHGCRAVPETADQHGRFIAVRGVV